MSHNINLYKIIMLTCARVRSSSMWFHSWMSSFMFMLSIDVKLNNFRINPHLIYSIYRKNRYLCVVVWWWWAAKRICFAKIKLKKKEEKPILISLTKTSLPIWLEHKMHERQQQQINKRLFIPFCCCCAS